MEFNITYLERLILESLSMGKKSIERLVVELDLEQQIVFNILHTLLTKNLVVFREKRYALNQHLNQEIINELKDKDNLVTEYSCIVKTNIKESIQNNREDCFKYKKLLMDQKEKAILKSLIYNVDSFIDDILTKKNPPKSDSEEYIVFWGQDKLENITKNIINYL